MKKITNIKSIALWVLMPLMFLLMGCTNTETLEEVSISGRKIALSVIMPNEGTTRVGLEQDVDSKNFITKWNEDDEVQLFITQGNQHYELGKVGVTNISEDNKKACIVFELPDALDLNKPYSIHALSGISGTMVGEGADWYPFSTAELKRNVLLFFNAPLYSRTDVGSDLNPTLQFKHIGTYEVLHVTNNTDKMIEFLHRGFDVETPWYYKKAVGYLLPEGGMTLDAAANIYGENVSEDILIVGPGNTETIVSWYIPTQEKMNGAELKATIDGVAMKSANKKSSDVDIETGRAYHMYATWDGESLTFDNGDAGILTVEPNPIDFGSVEAGTTATGTFTVSNTGIADLTFEIQSLHGIFDVPESGQNFTLQVGESRPFTITFTPEAEEKDKPYSDVMTITSNGSNGTVEIPVTGKSKSREEERLTQVIPDDLRDQLDDYIPIYDGSNPPNIEGEFLMSPNVLVFDSTNGFNVGDGFADLYLKFYNQDMINNTLDYQEKQAYSESSGTGCFISGEGDNFSVFFNVIGVTHREEYDITYKTALVISGTKTDEGIKDLYYAFVFVEKSDDPKPYLIDAGDFRSFKDSDGMSEYNWWTSGSSGAKRHVPAKDKNLPCLLDAARIK